MCLLLFFSECLVQSVQHVCLFLLQEGKEVSNHNCQQHDVGVQCLQWIVFFFVCVCVQAISAFWGLCITLGGSPSLAQTLHHLAEPAMCSSSTLTSEVVRKLLTQCVSQQTILSAQDHNLFGVNAEDALEEAKKNIPLLKAIFLEHAYPKLTVLEAGFRQWATDIGGPFLGKDGWYFKHQAYALFQQISRVRKMSNNLKDTTRTDPVLKELLIAIKELPKRSKSKHADEPGASQASQPTSKKPGKFMTRALLRRLSSSPSSKAPIPSKLSQEELAQMFGAPAEDAVIISSDEGMDDLEAAADQEAAAELHQLLECQSKVLLLHLLETTLQP